MTDLVFDLLDLIITIPVVLFALTFHEFSHGMVAKWLGDNTAKDAGRLTLNPAKHIDPFGFICMVLFHFGWAKPVPINANKFKKPKWGMAISALAGPLSNLILAFFTLLVQYILFAVYPAVPALFSGAGIMNILYYFLLLSVSVNITFAVFNLIPIPPLDGSRILLTFLPPKQYFYIMKYERQIMMGFFIFILADSYVLRTLFGFSILGTVMSFLANNIFWGMSNLIGFIPGL